LVKFNSDTDQQMSSWQALDVLSLTAHPLYAWLACQHSLTEELANYLSAEIQVNVLKEYNTRLTSQECMLLNLTKESNIEASDSEGSGSTTFMSHHVGTNKNGVVRDIILQSNDVGYIGARTIMCEATWKHCQLATLGNTPIGTLLFNNPINSQRDIEVQSFAQLQTSPWADFSSIQHDKNQPIWARRSVFRLQQQPIIIHELFSDRLI
jgi:chorismate-pyruvate lyase